MLRRLIGVVGVAFWVAGCASQVGEEAALGIPEPSLARAEAAGVTMAEMGEGYWVFQRKCMECHEPRFPDDTSQSGWHPVVSGMAGNAGLSKKEEKAVQDYVKAVRS